MPASCLIATADGPRGGGEGVVHKERVTLRKCPSGAASLGGPGCVHFCPVHHGWLHVRKVPHTMRRGLAKAASLVVCLRQGNREQRLPHGAVRHCDLPTTRRSRRRGWDPSLEVEAAKGECDG